MGSEGAVGGGAGASSISEVREPQSPSSIGSVTTPRPSPAGGGGGRGPPKGMSLTALGSGKAKSLEEALVKEDKLAPVTMVSTAKSHADSHAGGGGAVVPLPAVQQPVMLVIAERINAKMSRDGNVSLLEIKGSLTLTANNDEAALCSVQLAVGQVEAFVFNTHPKVNKPLYDKSGLLQLKDITKGFPSARPVGILKWNHSSTSDDLVPFKVNCWPEEESRGQMNVSIEYTMDHPRLELHDVRVKIPLGSHENPNIVSADGSYKHNASAGDLLWEIPLIDRSNSSGSLEFNISSKNPDAFFPIAIQFSSNQLFCDLEVTSVRSADGRAPILYGLAKGMATEDYVIE